jgi:hypothetical protein
VTAAFDAWPFVIAAYAATAAGTVALIGFSLVAMRRAEARAEALDRQGKA